MKIRIRTVLAFAAAAALAACTTHPVQPRFGMMTVDTLVGGGRTECRVEYRFVSILNADDSPALQAIEQANTGYFFELEEFSGTAREAAEAALREITDEYLPELPTKQTYEVSAESEAAVVDTLLTYVITRSSYLGGAHGIYGIECHNYTLSDGYELTTADLFAEGRLPALDSLIRMKICEKYKARNDEELTAAGFFPDYIAATENFRITPEGITFHYNPYDIGCYALGSVEAAITSEEFARLRR